MRCQTQIVFRQLCSLCAHPAARAPREAVLPTIRGLSGCALRQQTQTSDARSSASVHSAVGNDTLSRVEPPETDAMEQQPTFRELQARLGPFSTAETVGPPPPLVIIISGPSGVGKDAVIEQLRSRRPDIHFVVTATSRSKREGEVDGVDYFFVSRQQFEEWLGAGELLEHAIVYGDYKGIPRQQVVDALRNDTDVVLRIDVQGAATIRSMIPEAISIFVAADSEEELVQRLVARKTETTDKMLTRILTARSESSQMPNFDYVVVNRDGRMDETVRGIEAILIAEKSRVTKRQRR